MKLLKQKYLTCFGERHFRWSLVLSLLMLVGSLVINFYAGIYALEKASNPVTDIILNNIRTYDVDMIFIYGPVLLWSFVGLLLLFNPGRAPFTLKSISLFVLIRSVFISLTHIGPFPTHIVLPLTRLISDFTSGSDLFFSAHTGGPFLLALIFWADWRLRILFVASSILFGAVVLLGHLHYSIDVLSAFFITYTIYHIARKIFPQDLACFDESSPIKIPQ